MEIKEIRTTIYEYDSISELPPEDKDLAMKAKEACKNSYSPYSNFKVGAAVMLDDNSVVTGTNQENSAYPSGLCAERVALFYSHAQHPGKAVKTIAISAFSGSQNRYVDNPVPPCGACRQVMIESEERAKSPVKVILVGEKKVIVVNSVSELLPLFFDKEFLNP